MKKNTGIPLLIVLCLLVIASIALAVWMLIAVLKADIPTWLKIAILRR